jgi:hypothetical protein
VAVYRPQQPIEQSFRNCCKLLHKFRTQLSMMRIAFPDFTPLMAIDEHVGARAEDPLLPLPGSVASCAQGAPAGLASPESAFGKESEHFREASS